VDKPAIAGFFYVLILGKKKNVWEKVVQLVQISLSCCNCFSCVVQMVVQMGSKLV